MLKFFTTLFILLFIFFIQGCQQDLEIQGSSPIYVNESQVYKAVVVSLNIEDADSYEWSVKSNKKDYKLENDESPEVTFYANSVGTYTLEVKVKKNNETFKTELEIEVRDTEVVNGYKLPPEPDQALNDSTLLGIDSNENGVRDDVERYVIKRYAEDPDFPKTKTALAMQYAWAEQKIIENPVIESKQYSDDAIDCQYYWFDKQQKDINLQIIELSYIDSDASLEESIKAGKWRREHEVFNDPQLRNKIFNTRERIERSFQFNQACSGHIFDGREESLDNCQINIDELGE